MSERVAAVGKLTEKPMDLRTFANGTIEAIEDSEYGPFNPLVSLVSSRMDAYYEDIGGLCEHILTLPEPEPEVDAEDFDGL